MTYDKAAELAKTDLFRGLRKRVLNRLAEGAVILQHPAGTAIVDEGDKGISLHLILDGTAEVTVNGKHRADLSAGQYFGEIAVLDGKPRTASVTATSELTTLTIGIWNLQPIFLTEPSVMSAMVQVLCARLRAIDEAGIPTPRVVLPDTTDIVRQRITEEAPTG
jgi:CRP/FNR family cyclic AMP-dependent transcriptional regulator